MAKLSAVEENHIMMVGIGFAACAVMGVMWHMLVDYRDSVEVKRPPQKTQYITQSTEDSLKPSTLEKLIESHNFGIKETAKRIVFDRALHDGVTLDALLRDVTRPDHGRREQALQALNFMSQTSNTVELDTPKVYNAIVKCLTYCSTDVPHEPYDKNFDNFIFRDPVERLCLLILLRLSYEFGPDGVINAGFVQKWLGKEPWGSTQEERDENFAHCFRGISRLSDLIARIASKSEGLQALKEANLFPKKLGLFDDTLDIKMINGESTAGERGMESGLEGGPRVRDQSAEERHLRRRHREAMVLNDGVAPIAVSDIIEREYDSPIEERR